MAPNVGFDDEKGFYNEECTKFVVDGYPDNVSRCRRILLNEKITNQPLLDCLCPVETRE